MNKNPLNLPTETLTLPSKGILYPETSPLRKGTLELILPTAKQEDILTNRNYIENGTVIDKFIESIVVDDIDLNELLVGDKEAIILAGRILAFGTEYKFQYDKELITLNLGQLKEKEINFSLFENGINEFECLLPLSKKKITFKIPTVKDMNEIDKENKSYKKLHKDISNSITTYLKHVILAVNDSRDSNTIRTFVDSMPIRDSKVLRNYIDSITPGIEEKFDYTKPNGEVLEGLDLPMTVEFFWPK